MRSTNKEVKKVSKEEVLGKERGSELKGEEKVEPSAMRNAIDQV
jgi:hypothetical protein